uniref:Ulp1 protease family, C-terminal catalytic domain containing protein n=1 Tax=Solanum tuberosum TaxID=4113 RepID=M1AKV4_SOLTU
MSHSNCCNIQSGSVLPLPTVDHSVVDRRKEERSKEYLRRRKLDEIKKGKSIAFDPEDQGRSVNVKRRKFIEVAPQKSKLKNWELYFEVGKHKKPKLGAPNLDFVKSFEEKLTKSQLQIFSDTCFGFFLKLPPVMIQTQLIHSLLMMEVVQENTDEIWLLVNGSLIHFGLGEFAIMTGLKCNGVENENCNSWEKNNLIDRCFDGIKKITAQTIADFFEGKRWTTDQDAVKISILHFINTFLLCDLPENKVPNWHFEVVESGEYETYPWGKLVFHETFASLKKVLRGKIGKKFSKLYGLLLAFQVWFYECCAQSNEQFAIMIGKRIPRILSWNVLYSSNSTKVSEMLSATKLKVRNISATPFEKSAMNLNDLVGDVVVNDESNGVEVASQLVDDDFSTTPPLVSSKTKNKPKSVPPMNNMNVIDAIRRISDGQKELREDFQVIKQEVHSLKKLMMESDSKNFNAIEALSDKVDRNNDSKYEEFRGRGVNVDCDEEYYENNINCDQHVTLHLDNIQTINEDSNNESKIGASSKSIVTVVHPFGSFTLDDKCFKEMGEFREWMNEGRRPRNKKYPYIKKDNTLNPPFEFGKTIINKKDWFHKFAFGGQTLEMKFTTTDYLFDLKIKALYKKFIENNGDGDVVKPEHDIAKYILGEFVFSNRLWHTVDHILFPLCVDDQWLMARLSFKDRSINVYDSMGDVAFRANIRSSVDAYRFIIPLFLLILNFFGKRTDIQLNNGPYKNKALVDSSNVVMIKDLPLQQDADRGIYVALFAERFICGSNVFDNEFDVNTHRIKFGSLLWNYGKMKLEKHISSESKSSGIMKKIDHVKHYNN